MSKHIIVCDEIYRKFQAALLLTGDEEQSVLSELIKQYANNAFSGALDKQSNKAVTEDNQEVKGAASEEEQKRLFINWFRSITRNGKPYNPVTISGYAGRIENACQNKAFSEIPVKNLFSITSLTQFLDIQDRIKSCEGYEEFDSKSHNGFTAALRKYEEFLSFQATGNTVQSPSTHMPYSYKRSNIHRWTMEEDEICCKRFLEYYVVKKSAMDIVQFLQMLSKEVPEVSEGSLRMKIQNVKYLSMRVKLEDTASIKPLSQYSMQCERAFEKTALELGL